MAALSELTADEEPIGPLDAAHLALRAGAGLMDALDFALGRAGMRGNREAWMRRDHGLRIRRSRRTQNGQDGDGRSVDGLRDWRPGVGRPSTSVEIADVIGPAGGTATRG